MNSWDDKNFVAAIEKSGRKKIVLAGFGRRPVLPFRRFRRFMTATKSMSWKIAAET